MLFIQTLIANPLFGMLQIVAVIFSVCCHEYAHAQMALWQGDATAAEEGHLTLNPLKQMGPMSLLMLLFIGLAWGAVPVNRSRMRHSYSEALVSFAGPATNIFLFILSSIAFGVCLIAFSHGDFGHVIKAFEYAGMRGVYALTPENNIPITFFHLMAVLNVALFLLNMLPVPILDGWKVYNYLFAGKLNLNSELAKGAVLLIIFGVFMGGDLLFRAGDYALGAMNIMLFHMIALFGGG
jgi:Zn-dependent protease